MIGRLDHVAIAVPDLERAAATYRDLLGARISEPQDLPEHGVRVVFVELTNTRIELMEPLGRESPIANFLERKPGGGLHTSAMRWTTSSPPANICSARAPASLATASPASAPTANASCSFIPRTYAAPWSSCRRPDGSWDG